MSRREMIYALAPVAPVCFDSRLAWLEYLSAAAEAQSEKGQPAPLIFKAGHPVRFNLTFPFCTDCSEHYRSEMQRQGRCKPGWLLRNVPTLTDEVRDATPA